MMKSVPLMICFAGLCHGTLHGPSAVAANERAPTHDEVIRLVTLAWKPVPESFEIVYFKTVRNDVFDEELHRGGLTWAMEIEKTDPGALVRSDAERRAWVEEHMEIQRQKFRDGRRLYCRIRKRGFVTRWDMVEAAVGEELSLETPFEETCLQLFDPRSGRFLGMDVVHGEAKSADVHSDPRRKTHIDEAWDWGRFPAGQAIVLQLATCRTRFEKGREVPVTGENGDLTLDAERVEQLQRQQHPMLSIGCRDTTVDDVPCVTFVFRIKQMERHGLEITCWKTDLSVAPVVRGFDVSSGDLMAQLECSEYNTAAEYTYPRVVRSERAAAQGKGRLTEQIIIHSMSAPADFPERDLEFVPPRGYLWTDSRGPETVFLETPLDHLPNQGPSTGRHDRAVLSLVIINLVTTAVVMGLVVWWKRRKSRSRIDAGRNRAG